jgi:short-subunit dehydrogenase
MAKVFITGATSGLGEGLARHYAGPHTTLGISGRRASLLGRLATELTDRGAVVHVYEADVADSARMRNVSAEFVDAAGGIDVVVANAGVALRRPTIDADVEATAQLFATNVIGVSNTVLSFLPAMLRARAGTLVAVGSIAGFRGLPGHAAYSASKAAVQTFMDALRMELRDSGVHAMTLCPGFVRTPMTARNEHRMPFLLDLDEAVVTMAAAIVRRETTFSFPWPMRVLKEVMKRTPESLLPKLVPSGRRTRRASEP